MQRARIEAHALSPHRVTRGIGPLHRRRYPALWKSHLDALQWPVDSSLPVMTGQRTAEQSPTACVLGVPVSLSSMEATLGTIEEFIANGEPHLVVTADSSGFAMAEEDRELRAIYEAADLVTPDSQGVVWALGKAGHKHVTRVSGVDLFDQICRLSANKGYRLFFLGAAPGVAEMTAEKIRLRHPGCNIVGTRNGYFPADDDEVVAAEVANQTPDVLFVAMGIPRQEKFIFKTMGIVRAKVSIGVGGSFDVFSGKAKRAPVVVQRLKLEWLWRLVLNPSKFSKVKMLPRFVRLVLRDLK